MFVIIVPVRLNGSDMAARDSTHIAATGSSGGPAVLVLDGEHGLRWKEAPSSGWRASAHASGSLGVDVLQTSDG